MQPPAVEIIGLSKRFKHTEAVRRVNLEIPRGEMFALVGPDGAGKTTLLRLLCGILKPSAGSARILGLDLRTELSRIKERIGYFSQGFSLYGDLSVDENIEFFAEIHGVGEYRSRREELLEFTRLMPFRRRLAEKLSGGMKQKLALACTLIHSPGVLFLDEPTTGVDPVSRREFWIILSGLLEQGITILLTTPYMDEAERCHRVGLIDSGRLLTTDTPAALKSRLKGSLEEIVCPEVRKAYSLLRSEQEGHEVQIFGDRLHVLLREPERERSAIRRLFADRGIEIRSWRPIQPRLENVFLSLLEAEKESKSRDASGSQRDSGDR